MLIECSVTSEGAEKKRERVGSFDTLITSRRKRKIQTENFSPSSYSCVTKETCRKFPFFGATFVQYLPRRLFEDISKRLKEKKVSFLFFSAVEF
jgi:hypothetical protein